MSGFDESFIGRLQLGIPNKLSGKRSENSQRNLACQIVPQELCSGKLETPGGKLFETGYS